MLDLTDPMGKAKIIDDDGHAVVIRRPRYRDFEERRLSQTELQHAIENATKDVNERVQELRKRARERAADAAPDADADAAAVEDAAEQVDEIVADTLDEVHAIEAELEKFHQGNAERIASWWTDTIKLLGENPEESWPLSDWRDWPAWMMVGNGAIGELVAYWRVVPLDRGKMGHPTPS